MYDKQILFFHSLGMLFLSQCTDAMFRQAKNCTHCFLHHFGIRCNLLYNELKRVFNINLFDRRNSDQFFSTSIYWSSENRRPLALAAAPGISSQVGSAHPNPLLAPILNLVSHALESFQGGLKFLSGGLSSPQPTLDAATI
jgi:hypothetical protein